MWVHPRHGPLLELVLGAMPHGGLAHDREHLLRVYAWAVRLAPEAGADADLCGAAALVHDLAAVPKGSAERSLGGERSAAAAGPLLHGAGYAAGEQAEIIAAVASSSWSRGLAPAGPVGTVLQDADRLDAIGAIGVARCFACAEEMSTAERPSRFYDPDDPFARSGRPLSDRQQALDHFAAKLLHLAATMHTRAAQVEAQRRHATMVSFLAELESELRSAGDPNPR